MHVARCYVWISTVMFAKDESNCVCLFCVANTLMSLIYFEKRGDYMKISLITMDKKANG